MERAGCSCWTFSPVNQVVDHPLGYAGAAGDLEDRLLAAYARRPRARRPPRAGCPGRVADRGGGPAPATTMVTSPRTPAAAQSASSASGPRRTSSWVLVSSRQTAAARSPPNASAIAASAASVRCGASKNTIVRCSSASVRQPAGALPRLAGQEALEAEPVDRQTGDGQRGQHRRRPGDAGDADPVLDRGGDQPVAGVGHARHPGVGDEHDPLAGDQRLQQHRRPRALVALEVGHHPAGHGRRRGRWSAGAAAGCPRPPRRRPSRARRPAAARRRRPVRSASPRARAHRRPRIGVMGRSWQPYARP